MDFKFRKLHVTDRAHIRVLYRVTHLLANLIVAVPPLPGSAWADGKLEELAEQLGKMVEHPKSKSTNPGSPGDGSPCRREGEDMCLLTGCKGGGGGCEDPTTHRS